MSQPLRSTPDTGVSPLLRAGPPAHAASVLRTSRFQPPGALPLAPPHAAKAVSARAFPRSAHKPQTRLTPPARRAPPGQSAGSRQAHPGIALRPRFRCRFLLSALQQWFTRVRLPDPHLTALTPPFPPTLSTTVFS